MIYLDNAATSFPKPPAVAEAMARFLAHDAANPGRAGHRMAVAAEAMIDQVRLKLSRFIDGEDFHRLIFTMNCSDGLNMAIKGVIGDRRGVHVISSHMEHNSVNRPLQALVDRGRIELTRVGFDGEGKIDPDDIRKAIRPETVLIVTTHASNVLGTIQDAAAVGRIAREHDLLFCLDAAQSIGVVPLSVQQMQVDLLAFPGHKSLLGPTGIGALYVGPRCGVPSAAADRHGCFRPWREGGTGGDSASPLQPPVFPYFLEGGTPNTVGIAGLSASLDYVLAEGMDKTRHREQAMVQQVIDRLADDRRFTVYGTRDATGKTGALSLSIEGLSVQDAAAILDDTFQIAVRSGLHCAPYAHQRMGTFPDGTLRLSPGPFNTDQDMDALLRALTKIAP